MDTYKRKDEVVEFAGVELCTVAALALRQHPHKRIKQLEKKGVSQPFLIEWLEIVCCCVLEADYELIEGREQTVNMR